MWEIGLTERPCFDLHRFGISSNPNTTKRPHRIQIPNNQHTMHELCEIIVALKIKLRRCVVDEISSWLPTTNPSGTTTSSYTNVSQRSVTVSMTMAHAHGTLRKCFTNCSWPAWNHLADNPSGSEQVSVHVFIDGLVLLLEKTMVERWKVTFRT